MKYQHRRMRQASHTRGLIIDAAARIAVTEGLARVSVIRIAELVGSSTGAVRRHFESVDDVRCAVVSRWCRDIARRVIAPAKLASNGLGRIWALTELWLIWSPRLPFPISELTTDRALEQRVREPALRLMKDWLEVTRAALARAERLGELRSGVDIATTVARLHAMMWGAQWMNLFLGTRRCVEIIGRTTWGHLRLIAAAPEQSLPSFNIRIAAVLNAVAPWSTDALAFSDENPPEYDEAGSLRPIWDLMSPPDDPGRIAHERAAGLPIGSTPNSRLWDLNLIPEGEPDPLAFP